MKKNIKIENNKYIRFFLITVVVLGGLITVGTFFASINNYFYENIFIENNISDKIEKLSAGQSISYFKQELGSEKLQRVVSGKYMEYVFEYKESFIQTLVDENNQVIYWAITYCGKPVAINREVFNMAGISTGEKDSSGNYIVAPVFGEKISLNKSKFSEIFKNTMGDFKYFISGATANSFIYESVYLGNPSAYQTIIIGVNDVCSIADETSQKLPLFEEATKEEIDRFRETSKFNTYGETAPFYGDEILKLLDNQHSSDPYITFGVNRISVRYFNK